MAEPRRLWIPGPIGRLEAQLRVAAAPRGAAVIAHPHPLHGGTLHNAVVFHADRELHRAGWTTLRFNFRGVERSEGEHDDGHGEVADLGAAVSWLRGIAGDAPLLAIGYSFGSRCAILHAIGDRTIAGVVAIGLPVRTWDFADPVRRLGRPLAVVQGDADEFGPPDEVAAILRRSDPPGTLRVVAGATHLFPGMARDAAAEVVRAAGEIA